MVKDIENGHSQSVQVLDTEGCRELWQPMGTKR